MIVWTAAYGHENCDAMGSVVALARDTCVSAIDSACEEEEDFCATNDEEPMECNLWTVGPFVEDTDKLGLTDEQTAELAETGYVWLDC